MTALFADPTFWVAMGLALFAGVILWQKVPARIAAALDKRAADIAKELDDARRLREEAQALLAQYQRRQREAEGEAQAILSEARGEAERFAAEARAQIAQQIERRAAQAQEKIAQAEAQAMAEIRALAADAAIAAAEAIIREKLDAKGDAKLVAEGLKDVAGKLN